MNKITIISIFLCCFFIVSGFVIAKDYSGNAIQKKVKKGQPKVKEKTKENSKPTVKNNWNIKKIYHRRYYVPQNAFYVFSSSGEIGRSEDGSITAFNLLQISNGTGILNPQTDENSKPISPTPFSLNELTFEKATKLWGKPDGEKVKVFRRYVFKNNKKKIVYFIDTKFVDGILNCYRIRGPKITNASWVKIR